MARSVVISTRLRLAWAVLGWACQGAPPPSFEACPDAGCRVAWVLAEWEADPDAAAARVAAVEDPALQVALVEALSEVHPGQVGQLCLLLGEGPSARRCRAIDTRPHLRLDAAPAAPGAGLPADPLAHAVIEADAGGTGDPWQALAPAEVPCPPPATDAACRQEAARRAVQSGDVEGAAGACRGLAEARWRQECFFQAAELAVIGRRQHALRTTRIPGAVSLCRGAGPYLGRCLVHLQGRLARSAPPADAVEPSAWEPLSRAAAAAGEAVAGFDAELSRRLVAHTWGQALRLSYAQVDRVSGQPLDLLPAEVHPHVRAAAALRLLELEGEQERSLEAWVDRLARALADRAPAAEHSVVVDPYPIPDRWTAPGPGELDGLVPPAIASLGASMRLLGESEREELALCLVEAAAVASRPLPALLAEGARDPSPRVRWTAQRLLEPLTGSRSGGR